jgi:ubiquinone biosynthesis protein
LPFYFEKFPFLIRCLYNIFLQDVGGYSSFVASVKLQDQVKTVPYEELVAQVEEDLGAKPEEIFAQFSCQPLAAASISQVYKARLHDGSEVIVKIRRPGIRSVVEADLRLLAQLADIAEQEIKVLQRYRPKEIAHQFTLSMRRELDLAAECRNAERMMTRRSSDKRPTIPKSIKASRLSDK